MRGPAEKRDTQLYCHFHKDHGHTTEECKVLQREIENLITKGHFKQFVKINDRQQTGRRGNQCKTEDAPPKDPPVINTISGGPSARGLSSSSRKAYARQINLTQGPIKRVKASATLEFDDSYLEGVVLPHDDALVITLWVDAFQVKLKVKSSYNGILGRTGLKKLQAVASTHHLVVKFPTPKGVGCVRGEQTLARRCYIASCKAEETFSVDDQHDERTIRRAEAVKALIFGPLIEGDDERQLRISSTLEPNLRDQLISFLQSNMDIFAWSARFLSKSAERCLPFFKALKNSKKFEWTSECQASFDALKEYIALPPLLSKPVAGEAHFLFLAIAESTVSVVLIREQDSRQLPIYYVSKVLQGAELR
ncbi:hypothetical protein RJ639_013786 [Escallonia herrerae]|uniref:Reverse transcriptase/retrotransposon-derived protein RNase H-like domain-containing protein n=1 Tax=Escallonia herrerae TaxID=1293975 RepID=A0AA89ARE3_9ASTE|nr:hypothetical protein RJ639_013786 [Escallonia herrerae]